MSVFSYYVLLFQEYYNLFSIGQINIAFLNSRKKIYVSQLCVI